MDQPTGVGPYGHPDKREFSSSGHMHSQATFPTLSARRFGRIPLPKGRGQSPDPNSRAAEVAAALSDAITKLACVELCAKREIHHGELMVNYHQSARRPDYFHT